MLVLTVHLFNPSWQITRKYLSIYHNTSNLMYPPTFIIPQAAGLCACVEGVGGNAHGGWGDGRRSGRKKKEATFFSEMTNVK